MPSILLPTALFQQWKPRKCTSGDPSGNRPASIGEHVAVAGVGSGRVLRSRSTNPARPAPSTACRRSRYRTCRASCPSAGRTMDASLESKLFETVAALASADGHLPNGARKAIRFGPPRLASLGFVKKLRHAGTQCYSKAAQRVDPDV
jgi:hypothetical protein